MWKSTFLAALALASTPVAGQEASEPATRVLQIVLDDEAITPITAEWISKAIERAEREGAVCLLVVLDTPGGLVDSTRTVVKAILRARVPVVVFVPPGGRAASAGLFVALAAHVVAMAPGSNMGAAHPVQIGGLPITPPAAPEEEGESERSSTVLEDKAVNDTTAWARSLAELRGRDAEWAARAVRESHSVTAEEALVGGIIDLVARDAGELLEAIDGRQVELLEGARVLHTAKAELETVEIWWGQRLLAVLCNPNVAFLLLIFGFYGILFELYSPGWGVAGTLGAVAIVLGFFGLAYLPINYVGLLLIAIALGMFVAEAFVTSFGALTLGGLVCLVLGGLMLVDSPAGFLRLSVGVILPVAAATALITVFLIGSIVRAHRGRVRTGSEGLLSEPTVAEWNFDPDKHGYMGTVRTHGELWSAESETPVRKGDELEVKDRRGMTLVVALKEPDVVGGAGR